MPTPSGVKVEILFEEIGLPYEAHRVGFRSNNQMSLKFLSFNPNSKIPALVASAGPGGKPAVLSKSGAILIHLVEKSGQFTPAYPASRCETILWLMFQMSGIGPISGQLGLCEAGELLAFSEFANIRRVLDAFIACPAVAEGLDIPG